MGRRSYIRSVSTSRRRLLVLAGVAVGGLALPRLANAEATAPVKKMRILILGGTGFIGPHQVQYALDRGHEVTTFNRGRQQVPWRGQVEELLGDRDTGELKALEGRSWDVVIDNPTTLPKWVRDAGQVLAGHVEQYIFISTISVYASNAHAGDDETAALVAYAGKDPYAETTETMRSTPALYGALKALSEKEAERLFPGQATIIRPGLIVGPNDPTDRFTYWPVRIDRGGDVLAPGDGSDRVQYIDQRDLGEWSVRMAEQQKPGVYNASGPAHPQTMREMLGGIRTGLGSNARFTWVPETFLDKENVSPWRDMPAWVPGSGATAGFLSRSLARAQAAGLTYRPLAVTARDTLAWFKTLPADRQAKLGAGLSTDREIALLAKWSADQTANG